MTKASDNAYPSVLLADQGSAPTSPAAGERRLYVDSSGILKWVDSGGTVSSLAALNKWNGTAAPTTSDDSGDGYAVGSRWIDTTNDKEYVCLDATAGAAVWTETTAAAGAGGSGAPELPLDAAATSAVGSGDLFSGTSLDGGWSDLQTTAVTEKDRSVDGYLILKNTGNTGGADRGLKRTFSPAGDFTVYAKILYVTSRAAFQWAGIFVGETDPSDGAGADRLELHFYRTNSSAGQVNLNFKKVAAGSPTNVFDANIATLTNGGGILPAGSILPPHWLRIKRVGTTLTAGVSWDGVEFIDHATTTTIAFTVGTCGLYLGESTATDDMRATFGYIATTG